MSLTNEELQKINVQDLLNARPSKDIYYLAIAFVVAQASFDPSSKCGAVIVSKDGRIISTGYNGPIKHSKDDEIPMIRPDRYFHIIHSEENAILAYNGSFQDISGATIYVTGLPCHRCLRMILQKGITRIVYGVNHTFVVDQADINAQKIMLRHHPEIEVTGLENNFNVEELLKKTIAYMESKKSFVQNYTK